MAHRGDEQENLRLLPGPLAQLVIQEEVKGFGDAVTRAEAHLDRATGAYTARSDVEVGGALLSQSTISAGCMVAPFTALPPKDAPEPILEADSGRPTPR